MNKRHTFRSVCLGFVSIGIAVPVLFTTVGCSNEAADGSTSSNATGSGVAGAPTTAPSNVPASMEKTAAGLQQQGKQLDQDAAASAAAFRAAKAKAEGK